MFQLTTFGQEAVTAAMAGETEITFTNLKTASTSMLITVDGYKDFASIKQSVAPTSISYAQTLHTVIVSGVFSNENVAATYNIVAVGLYATCAGTYSRSTPTLFAYDVLSRPEPMPASSAGLTTRTYAFNTTIDNALQVNITVEPGAYALAEDLSGLQATVEENRLENGIVEATHSKQGNNHYLTVNNAAKNIKFKATAIFDYNDVFYFNNTLYEATTISGNALAPGYFNTGQIVMAFVDNSAHKLVFNDADRIGMMVIYSGTLIDYVDALPLGFYTLWYPYTNTDDPLKPVSRDMYVEVYKPSVNSIIILAHVFNPSDPHDYKTCKINGSWSVVWQEY